MQRPNEQKRKDIVDVATRLFATRPFHEVRLDDIAAKAKIGKGTIYIYFKSKEDLYEKVVREGFGTLLQRLKDRVAEPQTPSDALRQVVGELVNFGTSNRWIFQLLRIVQSNPTGDRNVAQRMAIGELIAGIIRTGIARGEFCDPHPDLTAHFLPAMVRASIHYGPQDLSPKKVADHVYRIVAGGLKAKGKKA
jgi:AcrR family transcriptional regulator